MGQLHTQDRGDEQDKEPQVTRHHKYWAYSPERKQWGLYHQHIRCIEHSAPSSLFENVPPDVDRTTWVKTDVVFYDAEIALANSFDDFRQFTEQVYGLPIPEEARPSDANR